jgi:2-polyprenyl-3-methyl-5-hydroxy-6-metoxy-1,4-benzoquinol methylase
MMGRRAHREPGRPRSGALTRSTVNTTEEDASKWLDILKTNQGFVEPQKWIDYARRHGFKKVSATKVSSCPDCGGVDATTIGQYVYYSTLISLRTCTSCRLLYSDTRISPQVVGDHFERTYVDDDYFRLRRKQIFEQIANETAARAPMGGAVMDVGGAKGHLMALVKSRRPDLDITVNDLSASKCRWAESHYGLRTICGSAAELGDCGETFDVVTAIDVLYYEPDIARLWRALNLLLKPGGTLILRTPNNLSAILLHQRFVNSVAMSNARRMRATIRYFNPEHLYVFSKAYLKHRLASLGFGSVRILPSPMLISGWGHRYLVKLYDEAARAVCFLSAGRGIITPGMLVIASKRATGEGNAAFTI